jgi:hypothetical protein
MKNKMIFIKVMFMCVVFTFPLTSFSNENVLDNGWNKELYKASVDSCIASAVNNNMKHIIEKENIEKDSDEYIKILTEIQKHQSAVCNCTQEKIVKKYNFSDIDKIMNDKIFIINAAKSCNKKILANKN